MKVTDYECQAEDSFTHAIVEGYKRAPQYRGIPGSISGAGQYVGNHKIRSILFTAAVASTVFTAMHVKAGYINAAEAYGFLAKTFSYFVGLNEAMAASLPQFIGTGIFGQVVAGVMMGITAGTAAFVLYKGVEKVCTYLTDAKTAQVTPPQQQNLGNN